MADFDDTLGIEPTGVVESLLRQQDHDLGVGPVDPTMVLRRLIRKSGATAQAKRQQAATPPAVEPQDFSSFGAPSDAVAKPPEIAPSQPGAESGSGNDFSSFGAPAEVASTPSDTPSFLDRINQGIAETGGMGETSSGVPATFEHKGPPPKPADDYWPGHLPTAGSEFAQHAITGTGSALKGAVAAYEAYEANQAGNREASKTPEEKAKGQVEVRAPVDPRNSALYQTGENVEKYGRAYFPTSKTQDESVTGMVSGGLGGLLGMTPGIAVGTMAGGPLGGIAAGAAQMAASSAGDTFTDAINKGATPEEAAKAAGLSALAGGALGALPLGVILRPVKQLAPGLLAFAATKLEHALQSGVVFGAVGEAQHYLAKEIEKNYNQGYVEKLQGDQVKLGAEIAKVNADPRLASINQKWLQQAGEQAKAINAALKDAAGYEFEIKRLVASLLTGAIAGAVVPPYRPATNTQVFLNRVEDAPGHGTVDPGPQPVDRGPQWRKIMDDWIAARDRGENPPEPTEAQWRGEEPYSTGPARAAEAAPGLPRPEGEAPAAAGAAEQRPEPRTAPPETATTEAPKPPEGAVQRDRENDSLVAAGHDPREIADWSPEQRKAALEAVAEKVPTGTRREREDDMLARYGLDPEAVPQDGRDAYLAQAARTFGEEVPRDEPKAEGVQTDSAAAEDRDRREDERAEAASNWQPTDQWRLVPSDVLRGYNDLTAFSDGGRIEMRQQGKHIYARIRPRLEPAPPEPPKVGGVVEQPRATGTRDDPVELRTGADLRHVDSLVNEDYTHAQGEANNVRRVHGTLWGIPLTFEAKAGGVRRGTVPKTGEPWETTMGATYGYAKGTEGADGDHVDFFVGPHPETERAFIIDELGRDGTFQQHKVMAGFLTTEDAIAAFDSTSSKRHEDISGITTISADDLKVWLKDKKATKSPLAGSERTEPQAAEKPAEPAATTRQPAGPAAEEPTASAPPAPREHQPAESKEVPAEKRGPEDLTEAEFRAAVHRGVIGPAEPDVGRPGFTRIEREQIEPRGTARGLIYHRDVGMNLGYSVDDIARYAAHSLEYDRDTAYKEAFHKYKKPVPSDESIASAYNALKRGAEKYGPPKPASEATLKDIEALKSDEVPPAEFVDEGPAEAGPQHNAAIETALREAGVDPDLIRPVDIARAAEVHAEEGYDPSDAFQLATVRGLVEDSLLTDKQVREIYGNDIADQTLLATREPPQRGLRAPTPESTAGGPPTPPQDRAGSTEQPPRRGEAGQGEGTEAGQGRHDDQRPAVAGEPHHDEAGGSRDIGRITSRGEPAGLPEGTEAAQGEGRATGATEAAKPVTKPHTDRVGAHREALGPAEKPAAKTVERVDPRAPTIGEVARKPTVAPEKPAGEPAKAEPRQATTEERPSVETPAKRAGHDLEDASKALRKDFAATRNAVRLLAEIENGRTKPPKGTAKADFIAQIHDDIGRAQDAMRKTAKSVAAEFGEQKARELTSEARRDVLAQERSPREVQKKPEDPILEKAINTLASKFRQIAQAREKLKTEPNKAGLSKQIEVARAFIKDAARQLQKRSGKKTADRILAEANQRARRPAGMERVITGEPPGTKETKGTISAAMPMPRDAMSGRVVDAIAKEFPEAFKADKPEPMMETIKTQPGANIGRMAKLLGPKLYGEPKDLPVVSVKEMFQNSFDAIKGAIERGQLRGGKIDLTVDPDTRTISIRDNGLGMTPEVLSKEFFQIAGTSKETERASGGLGIAKMLFLFGNNELEVVTLRNGKLASVKTTGPDLFEALDDASKAPTIETKNISRLPFSDRDIKQMFPEGHGTFVSVKVPEKYRDPSSGEEKSIYFPHPYPHNFHVLERSPLFTDIDVTLNGNAVNGIGTRFPANSYSQLADVKFDWGEARIVVSKNKNSSDWNDNLHVLSNGLWQFSLQLKKNPLEFMGPAIPYTFYIDVASKVRPEDSGYPFDLNRQKFSKQAEDDFEKIFRYLSILYKQKEFNTEAASFGAVHYLDRAASGVAVSEPIDLTPSGAAKETTISAIQPGDEITIQDGRLIVNGREVPVLTAEDLKKADVSTDDLLVGQDRVDPDRVMLHDNLAVGDSPITASAREKFGARFDNFVFEIGDAFRELRDVVAEAMNYPDLRKEAVGISFDKEYRGVSIRIPFSGLFVNPGAPEYADPRRAAVGIAGTMVHELAHHQVRSHDASFPAEMQRILIALDVSDKFDFPAFKRGLIKTVSQHNDVLDFLHGAVHDPSAQPIGKRFEDARPDKARDGSVAETVGGASTGGEQGALQQRIGDAGAEPGREGVPRQSVAAPLPAGLYSAVERLISDTRMETARPDQWMGLLRNKPGIKAEELKWLGIAEWLGSQEGQVTKQAVLDYVRANQIKMREVEKFDKDAIARMPINQIVEYNRTHTSPPSSKFEGYQLPGGENYRELLLTLPQKEGVTREDLMHERQQVLGPEDVGLTAEQFAPSPFRSSHWDEPNVLAHIRFNDRTIDGKKTLFIEEIQSDWHQKGKKQGYQQEYKGRQIEEIDRDIDAVSAETERRAPDLYRQRAEHEEPADWDAFWNANPDLRYRELMQERLKAQNARDQFGVPDAPFKTSWPELSLKRMIRYAAENGYEQIGWTPGKVQAERYDLSKQVRQISSSKGFNDTYRLEIYPTEGGSFVQNDVPAQKLPDVVGKDLADKIVAFHDQPEHDVKLGRFTGLDLKVGGEGMRAFYDRELVNKANALVKKYGAKVGEAKLKHLDQNDRDTPFIVLDHDGTVVQTDIFDEGRASEEARAIGGTYEFDRTAGETRTDTVHTLPIPAALRDAALAQGFPVFHPAPAHLTPAAETKRSEIERYLTSMVHLQTGRRIAVRFKDRIDSESIGWGDAAKSTAAGQYTPMEQIIRYALDGLTPRFVMEIGFHEPFHVVQDILATDQEMAMLERETPRLREIVRRHEEWGQYVDGMSPHEIQAVAYQMYARDRAAGNAGSGIHIAIRRLFERIMKFLREVANYLRGLGFNTSEDIFAKTYQGEMAKRPSGPGRLDRMLRDEYIRIETEKLNRAFVENVNRLREESLSAAMPRTSGLPAEVGKPVSSHTNPELLKAHPDYKAAKAGDTAAALRFVRDMIDPKTIAEAEKFGTDALYLPVVSVEATGHNKIPRALAEVYAKETGATAVNGIEQVTRAYHTGANAMERLLSRPVFDGPVQAGGRYVIVDDVTVMGATLAELAGYIRSKGGEVVGTVTLVNAARDGVLTPRPGQIREIQRRFGDAVRELFDIEPAALTGLEATYLLNFRNADALRARAASAGRQRVERLASKGIGRDAVAGGVSGPPLSPQGPLSAAMPMPRRTSPPTRPRRLPIPELAQQVKAFWTSTFQPELVSDRAFEADPLFARYRAASAQEKDALIRQSESEWNYWNKKAEPERLGFLFKMETNSPQGDATKDAMAARYRKMLDANWAEEQRWGSQAAFVEDYVPHIWKKPEAWRAFAKARTAQMGPTWFQKHRTFNYIEEGLAAGLELRFTNPVDIIVHRLLSGVDMRQRMQLLYALKDMGLSWEGKQGGDKLVRRGWELINAPDRKQWVIAPDALTHWRNAVEAKGLWQAEHPGGSVFRGWMALKNAWVPVKLALSAFHPIHVLHINQANGLARAWDAVTKGKAPLLAFRAIGEGFGGPLQAAPGASAGAAVGALLGSTVIPVGPYWGALGGSVAGAAAYAGAKRAGIVRDVVHPGKTARAAWAKRPGQQTAAEKAIVSLMTDGGFVPQLSEQLKITAKRAFAETLEKIKRREAGLSDYRRFISAAMRRPIELLQGPIFEQWIPNLKASAYLSAVSDLLRREPGLLTNDVDRRVAFRAIAKSIDNRFGEMFYGNLFWNRYVKDAGIASFLSLGWNLGFVREFGGAAMEAVSRPAGLFPPFEPSHPRKVAREATNKLAFAMLYMGSAALMMGMISAMFSGESPSGMDFIFPRIGGTNADGSPRRITNMTYLREIPMLLKHIQERGGNVLTGTGEMIWNKLMFEPFRELLNNRDYYGYNIWDENAPVYKQIWQGIHHLFAQQKPMSMSGAQRALDTGGTWDKDVPLSYMGFGPAPGYAQKSAVQNRIGYLYSMHVATASKPHPEGEESGELVRARSLIAAARQRHNGPALIAAYARGRALGMTTDQMARIGTTPSDIYLFSRLPKEDQKSILSDATPEEYKRYFPHAGTKTKMEINAARAAATR